MKNEEGTSGSVMESLLDLFESGLQDFSKGGLHLETVLSLMLYYVGITETIY
jgi:hypothetical protein